MDYDACYCAEVVCFAVGLFGPFGEFHAGGVFAFDGDLVASYIDACDVSSVFGSVLWGAVDAVVVECLG